MKNMKKSICLVVVLLATNMVSAQLLTDYRVNLKLSGWQTLAPPNFRLTLGQRFLSTNGLGYSRPSLFSWQHRPLISLDSYWSTSLRMSSRFDSRKLSFREFFQHVDLSFQSSGYVPGVKGVRVTKSGGEFWIKF